MREIPYYVRPKDFLPEDVHEELSKSARCYRQINGYKVCIQRKNQITYYIDFESSVPFWKKFVAYPGWLIRHFLFRCLHWRGKQTNYMHLDPIEYIVVYSRPKDLLLLAILDLNLVVLIVVTLLLMKS